MHCLDMYNTIIVILPIGSIIFCLKSMDPKTRKDFLTTNCFRYATNDFAAGEHGGTHMDAPYHFSATGQHIGQIPLDRLIVPRRYSK